MACYPCTHCNRCGAYSIKVTMLCKGCGNPVPAGVSKCPNCGDTKFEYSTPIRDDSHR